MAEFEMVETFDTILKNTSEENSRSFLIRYRIIKIDGVAEVAAEYEAMGETFEIGDDDELNEPDFFPCASITIRELTDSEIELMSDDPNENVELGKEVCYLSGWLIMSDLMEEYGYDPHVLCDSQSADLEHVWSALNDRSMCPMETINIIGNIFYAHILSIEPDYDTPEFKAGFLEGILGHLVKIINERLDDEIEETVVNKRYICPKDRDYYIDVISYFPSPLPFDNSVAQLQTDLACGLVSAIRNSEFEKYMNPDAASKQEDYKVTVAPQIYLRAAGMRISGEEPYPESAKNRAEWDLLELAGWKECGNTRLLYMTRLDLQ